MSAAPPKRDQIRLGPETVSGEHVTVRRRGDEVTTGVLGGVKEGRSIPEGAEMVALGAPDGDGWRDVKVLYRHETREPSATPTETREVAVRSTDGPAQVATPAYRENYDRIFGGKQKVGLA